jgi:(p)ppGpp synthase/HD superfamily hydrolase
MADLEKALQIAVRAHAGQKDKNGAPYIFHSIRVMTRCASPDAKIVALLHDVVEDTDVTFEELEKEGFSDRILAALMLVTRSDDETYEEFVERTTQDAIAIEVKIADLEDNSDIRRLSEVDEKTMERFKRYLAAYKKLTAIRDAEKG